ncbi:ribosome hibernation-promoting factor, HPF/YfiA family [Sinanaerobacter sp. ZZT-01]|uniref:ribosome hibernation-promoting factor, HPF/YfiA family n=1 Tax=Sinanaerobacter sp. ZZT-01 TaxID=3111540 RepID=UPI002D784289|nr:ribosome-associated translation inhibitor RaiA [Sinanaerobacter sp. ZZT-01]WRR94353.1 ribosome-associated translation inhibitor RaiA [Sinanaerobacter sp. ZZT-01]
MKVIITSKNFSSSANLNDTVTSKFEKLSKYFSSDIVANVTMTVEKERQRVEATINANGTLFRAEDTSLDAYASVDRVVDKLASQMSRFKTKLLRKHKGQKELNFIELPDIEENEVEDVKVVRRKTFELQPMSVDEAVMQMELLGHTFFVFLNIDTDSVGVVYKRKDKDYGLLETQY